MAYELSIKFNCNCEEGTGPASVDTGTFSAPALTYSTGKFYMTLTPIIFGGVNYYADDAAPYTWFTKDGTLSNVTTISADSTDVTAAVGSGSDDIHAFLLRWSASGTTSYLTVYCSESNKTALLAVLNDATVKTYLTIEAILESVFTPNAAPPGNYTYNASKLYIYTFSGYWYQTTPAMSVYKNGVLLTVTTDYTIQFAETAQLELYHVQLLMVAAPVSGDVITATYVWRHDCSSDEDVQVYEFDKEPNVEAAKDVNGRNIISEAYQKYSGYIGRLVWPYATYEWYDKLKTFAELGGSTITLSRYSLAGKTAGDIATLYVKNFPKWTEEPQVVDVVQEVSLDLIQLA